MDLFTSEEDAIEYSKKFSPPNLILMDMTLDGRIDGDVLSAVEKALRQ